MCYFYMFYDCTKQQLEEQRFKLLDFYLLKSIFKNTKKLNLYLSLNPIPILPKIFPLLPLFPVSHNPNFNTFANCYLLNIK